MNGLASNRRRRGLAACAINFGVMYGLGLLHRDNMKSVYLSLEREGYPPVSERDLHAMMIEAIAAGRPSPSPSSSVRLDDPRTGTDLTCGLRRYDPTNAFLHWHRDPRFGHFTTDGADGDGPSYADGGGEHDQQQRRLTDAVLAAQTPAEAADLVLASFRAHLHGVLRIPDARVTPDHAMAELGLDSLSAVEIRAWIFNTLALDVSVMKILRAANVGTCKFFYPPLLLPSSFPLPLLFSPPKIISAMLPCCCFFFFPAS